MQHSMLCLQRPINELISTAKARKDYEYQQQKYETNDKRSIGRCSYTVGAVAILYSVDVSLEKKYLSTIYDPYQHRHVKLRIPSELDLESRRQLSLNLGRGNCLWQPPVYDVPTDIEFHKTAIVGYPSGDKRMIFIQMEALTGWPAKDEWDFEYLGNSNHPFIKANYPHHEGIWGWGTNADQVVMMIRNIRRSMVEYHDILWDIGYAKTWEVATENLHNLYGERPPKEDFFEWRDLRVMEEIEWYGWFIDYWMEEGLMRDMFTHKITTPKHWNMLMMPTVYTRAELEYDLVVGPDTVVTPSYDPHCSQGDISGGCKPVAVISAERLTTTDKGPSETIKIAKVLTNNQKMSQHVIGSDAWKCIWRELIVNGKGLKTVSNRPGAGDEQSYSFSAEMLEAMITELTRLIDKYGSSEWNHLDTSNRIVELLSEHRDLIQTKLDELDVSARALSSEDFLGPKEREIRRKANPRTDREPNLKYFDVMARLYSQMKRRKGPVAKQ